MKSEELAIPIYLDTNTLLDLLASIEGGFSMVDKITTRSTDSKTSELSGGAEFGIAAVLNIFKINLRGSAGRKTSQEAGEERQTERYHTYGSLLNRLRANLVEEGLLKEIIDETSWQNINASDFIEVTGKFIPNPWRASMQTINSLLDLIVLFEDLGSTQSSPQQISFTVLRKAFEGMKKDLEHESLQTYMVELTTLPNYKVIVSLFAEYIRDRSGRELPYGEFRLLGKVIRKLEKDDSFNLLRGSAFAGITEDKLVEFLTLFQNLGQYGIKIPTLTTKVEGPAIQVIPIAVYA